ncbi:MAG: YlxM family DNA-binding protein [Thomasclavelia sp.]|nr:YlxM family DNA-binding protein [Thomasclavelia sp.]
MESMLEKKQRVNLLMDLYENLLTDKQREYLNLYYQDDLSLSEIALIKDVTRNAVFDNLKKAVHSLEKYEDKLQLLKKHQERLKIIEEIESDKNESHEELHKHLKMLKDI